MVHGRKENIYISLANGFLLLLGLDVFCFWLTLLLSIARCILFTEFVHSASLNRSRQSIYIYCVFALLVTRPFYRSHQLHLIPEVNQRNVILSWTL